MASTNQPDNPSYKCEAATRQLPSLEIVRDLAGGTPAMRKAGEKYLPSEEGESRKAYFVRLSRSLLFNTFVKVREGLIGMALKKRNPEADSDIELGDDVPPLIREHVEDIDLAGSHLDVFAKDLFRKVVNDGHAFIFVDMEQAANLPSVTRAGNTRADSIARRPYWVSYAKDQAINWKSDRIGGITTLTQITFKECATESDGQYSEKEVVRYRVLRLPLQSVKVPGRPAVYGLMEWELWEERESETDGVQVIMVDSGRTSLSRIPVVPIYARRTGFLESEPPLLDLAHLNVGHWQQWSDLNCQLRMLVPILEIRGDLVAPPVPATANTNAAKQQLSVGPGAALQFKDDKGGVAYKAADPGATQGMREALMDLEQRMSAIGLSIIAAKQDKEVTATEKVLDQDERQSELSSWVRALKDGIEASLQFHAIYLGLPSGGSVLMDLRRRAGE